MSDQHGEGARRVWRYAIDHSADYDTRHEAIGEAAKINRQRNDRRRDVAVWAYPVCDCIDPTVSVDGPYDYCTCCQAVIA